MNCIRLALMIMLTQPALPVVVSAVLAQERDTTRARSLEPVVVAADRMVMPVATATSAVTVLDANALARRPVRTLTEALQQAAGLVFVDFDGLGLDPQVMTRGFYGGGEAEYLLLLVDGRPVNRFESGRIIWDLIPMSAIQRIEIVRGGAAAAWGDAALAGVINVITWPPPAGERAFRGAMSGGSHGVVRAAASVADAWRGRDVALFGSYAGARGFRAHAERKTGSLGGTVALVQKEMRTLNLFARSDWRSVDEPGPLSEASLAESPRRVAPFFRFDHAGERLHELGVEGSTRLHASTLRASLSGDYRHADGIRTLPLSPDFADTKNRTLTAARVRGSAQLEQKGALVGVDASIGELTSEYFDVLQGDSITYGDAAATAARGDRVAHGVGSRRALAAFARYEHTLVATLRVSAGGRVDWLHDTFDSRAPNEAERRAASHVAFSPKVGVNYGYVSSGRHAGYVYGNVARSFKAPTPDQLFDQRPIPVPTPPFAITFANADLDPQYGTNVEVGGSHRVVLAPRMLTAKLAVSAYRLALRDELDFDLETFRYQNIGRSLHRGIEAALDIQGPESLALFGNYTLQSATSRIGENAGKALKAIPRHFLSAGFAAGAAATGFTASLMVSGAWRTWLDDANTQELPAWARWDLRLAHTSRGVRLAIDILNLWDRKYSTTAFPDAADPGVVYYYPAAPRTLQLGLSRDW